MSDRTPKKHQLHPIAGVLAVCLGIIGAMPAMAEQTGVEQASIAGGRIIGAAKACGVNAERVRKVSDRLLSVIGARAESAAERESAKSYFFSAQTAGAEQIRSERSKCSEIHVSFSEIEVKLGRAPGSDNDPLAAKRGIPALGALKTDTASGIEMQKVTAALPMPPGFKMPF